MLKKFIALTILLFSFLTLSRGFSLAQSANTANFSLMPTTGTYDNGTAFQVDIKLTGDNIDSAKVVIQYESTKVEIINLSHGEIFDFYDVKNFDNATGKLTLSANTKATDAGTKDVFGTITFKAKTTTSTPTLVSIVKADSLVQDSSASPFTINSTDASFQFVVPKVVAEAPAGTVTPTTSKLPNAGVLDQVIFPMSVAWALILTFLVILFFKTPKTDVMGRALSRERRSR